MRIIYALIAATLLLQIATPATANSKSPCVAQSISYNFILHPTDIQDESTQYHKKAQVIIDFAPNPKGNTTLCATPSSVPSPHPLTGISVIIDGFLIDIPTYCLEGVGWPIESVHVNSFKDEVQVEITAASTIKLEKQEFLGLMLDPEPDRSAWHKENNMPQVMCSTYTSGK